MLGTVQHQQDTINRFFFHNSLGLQKTTLAAYSKTIAHHKVGHLPKSFAVPAAPLHWPEPLDQIITKSGCGYSFQREATITHLFNTDDTKLSARSEQGMDSL